MVVPLCVVLLVEFTLLDDLSDVTVREDVPLCVAPLLSVAFEERSVTLRDVVPLLIVPSDLLEAARVVPSVFLVATRVPVVILPLLSRVITLRDPVPEEALRSVDRLLTDLESYNPRLVERTDE